MRAFVCGLVVCMTASTAVVADAQQNPWPGSLIVTGHPLRPERDGAYQRAAGEINGAAYYTRVNPDVAAGSRFGVEYIFRVDRGVWVLQSTPPNPTTRPTASCRNGKPWEAQWNRRGLQISTPAGWRPPGPNPNPNPGPNPVSISVTFQNGTPQMSLVYYEPPGGVETYVGQLPAGRTAAYATAVGGRYLFRSNGVLVDSYRVGPQQNQSYQFFLRWGPGAQPNSPPGGLQMVAYTLTNSSNREVWVYVEDLRTPGSEQRIRIAPRGAANANLLVEPRAANDATAVYEMHVYTVTQGIGFGAGGVSAVYAPSGVGVFRVASRSITPGAQRDVIQTASRINNPGSCRRLDNSLWTNLALGGEPVAGGWPNWGWPNGGGGPPPVIPNTPVAPPTPFTLANSHDKEIWVLIVAKGSPLAPDRYRIAPRSRGTIGLGVQPGDLNRQGALFEVSVYEAGSSTTNGNRTSSTPTRSLGWFGIAASSVKPGAEIDVYTAAVRQNNRGKAERIDPRDWEGVALIGAGGGGAAGDPPIVDPNGNPDPGGAPGVASLRAWDEIFQATEGGRQGCPETPLDVAVARITSRGLSLERTIWQEETKLVSAVEEQTKTVIVDGKEVEMTEQVAVQRQVVVPAGMTVKELLERGDYRVFSATGRELERMEGQVVLSKRLPAVVVRPEAFVDEWYAPMLAKGTIVVVDDRPADRAALTGGEPEVKSWLPKSPACYVTASVANDGWLTLTHMGMKWVEKTRPKEVTKTVEVEVDGKTYEQEVTVTVEETYSEPVDVPVEAKRGIGEYRVETVRGRAVDQDKLPRLLRRGTPVVYIHPGQEMDELIGSVFKSSTLVVFDERAAGPLPISPRNPNQLVR